MTDVTKLLSQDHRRVEQLFEQFEATEDRTIALKICDELTVHAELEEEIVYPALERIDAELEQEAEKEHGEAKALIARVRSMADGDSQLLPTMVKLKAAIEHHVKEEETEAWPKLREQLSTDRLETLGEQVESAKGEQTTGTTTTPTTTATTGPLIDLTKEELYEKAKQAGIQGRSSMTKKELATALQQHS